MKKLVLLIILSVMTYAKWNLYPTYFSYLKRQKDILNQFYFQANTNKKIVALTFDDGPNRHTAKIMKVLKKYSAPATFFLIANNLNSKYNKLYKNPLFSVGMHTYSHKNFDKLSKKQIDNDFKKSILAFKRHNLNYTLFRPAYGVINKKVANILNKYHIKSIIWSNDTNDWNKKLRNYKKVIDSLHSGDIILMHDHATTPKELEKLIINIRAKGFKIVPIKEILKYKSNYPINF
jgi:peptidoglycan/xylan/chitin deacetylase (PgdA/CDA1 family)